MLLQKKYSWLIINISVIGLCLIIGIIKICSEMPWIDEVFFADITNSLIHDNNLSLNIMTNPVHVITYGPVYFFIQKLLLSFLGFGMWQFRVINLVSGILLLFVLWIIAKKLNISKLNICILLTLLAFDSRFMFNMTSGRMDLFALLLFMTGWLLFYNNVKRTYLLVFLAGIISSMAYLTTPRIGFYFFIYVFTFVIELIESKTRIKIIQQYALFFLSILLPIFMWIFYAYGNILKYFDFYFNTPVIASHLGGSVSLPKYQIPIIILWSLSGLFVFRLKSNIYNPVLVTIFLLPLFHLLFIKEVGPYSAMMMPFLFLGIIVSINLFKKKLLSIIPGLYALIFLVFPVSSCFSDLASLEITNPKSFQIFLQSQKITNSIVFADFKYYYFIAENNNRFITFEHTKFELNECSSINSKKNIEYAIISTETYSKDNQLLKKLGFTIIAEYHTKKTENLLYRAALFLKRNVRTGYDGIILRRTIPMLNEHSN